jgi:hypothetical protein
VLLSAQFEALDRIGLEIAEAQFYVRLLSLKLALRAYNPDQPRVPPGHSDGGQWTSGGAGGTQPSAAPGGESERRPVRILRAVDTEPTPGFELVADPGPPPPEALATILGPLE